MDQRVTRLFGPDAELVQNGMRKLVEQYRTGAAKPWVTQSDTVLITYGDSIQKAGAAPLKALDEFLCAHVRQEISAVHILPCFPYTSDDGFSVVDYREIDPVLGSWEDIAGISSHFDLMLDAVINHASVQGDWFQRFLRGEEPYRNYFITADPAADYSMVTRPRTLPLLTEFQTAEGPKHVWTTFSDDQADLNYKCPQLFLEILDILGLYASRGARFIRLDAIGFLYKKMGTSCINLKETHEMIQLMRHFLEQAFPGTIIITETNVPHADNISYFGIGDEAHMVYQFPLPPLTLYSFMVGNAETLTNWAASLAPTGQHTAFFNFLASHDGIGLRPTEGILTDAEREHMVQITLQRGGLVSYKGNGDGSKSPYELNINYMDALSDPADSNEFRGRRLLAAHAILLSLAGMPGIYIHSLLGSRSDRQAALDTGSNRRINRAKLDADRLAVELGAERKAVFDQMRALLRLRRTHSAFSPQAEQHVISLDPRVFSLWRHNRETGERILALVNVSDEEIHLDPGVTGTELIAQAKIDGLAILPPASFQWILQGE